MSIILAAILAIICVGGTFAVGFYTGRMSGLGQARELFDRHFPDARESKARP